MEIPAANISQIKSLRNGAMLAVDDDVCGVAKGREIDPEVDRTVLPVAITRISYNGTNFGAGVSGRNGLWLNTPDETGFTVDDLKVWTPAARLFNP